MLLINYKTETNFHKMPNGSKSGVSLQYFNRGRNTAVNITQNSTMKLTKTYAPFIQEDIHEMNR